MSRRWDSDWWSWHRPARCNWNSHHHQLRSPLRIAHLTSSFYRPASQFRSSYSWTDTISLSKSRTSKEAAYRPSLYHLKGKISDLAHRAWKHERWWSCHKAEQDRWQRPLCRWCKMACKPAHLGGEHSPHTSGTFLCRKRAHRLHPTGFRKRSKNTKESQILHRV
jgi:hypothetical protein